MAIILLKSEFLTTRMALQPNDLTLLQAAIRQALNCEVLHSRSVPVHETMDGKTVWKGDVEVFDLKGHREAKRSYAWLQRERDKNVRFVAVLERPRVNSAELAVKSAIFFDVQAASIIQSNPPS